MRNFTRKNNSVLWRQSSAFVSQKKQSRPPERFYTMRTIFMRRSPLGVIENTPFFAGRKGCLPRKPKNPQTTGFQTTRFCRMPCWGTNSNFNTKYRCVVSKDQPRATHPYRLRGCQFVWLVRGIGSVVNNDTLQPPLFGVRHFVNSQPAFSIVKFVVAKGSQWHQAELPNRWKI